MSELWRIKKIFRSGISVKSMGRCGSGRYGEVRSTKNVLQEGRLSRVWSGQTPAACTHKGGEVLYNKL